MWVSELEGEKRMGDCESKTDDSWEERVVGGGSGIYTLAAAIRRD
jgi:hypothetical protein